MADGTGIEAGQPSEVVFLHTSALCVADLSLGKGDMDEDLVGIVEAELARALRAIDRACMVAAYLESHLPRGPRGIKARETTRRSRKVREMLLDYGIRLPPLRKVGEYRLPEEEQPIADVCTGKEISGQSVLGIPAPPGPPWTLQRIAQLAGVYRTTAGRWAYKAGVRHVGPDDPPLTLEEVKQVLRAGERAALADSL